MIFEKVKALLADQFDVEESEITLETNLFEDLDADSLDLADLLASIEDEFSIEADDDVIGRVNTVDDIVTYISKISN